MNVTYTCEAFFQPSDDSAMNQATMAIHGTAGCPSSPSTPYVDGLWQLWHSLKVLITD